MKYFYLSIYLILFCLPVYSQTTITGTVTDDDSNEPLIGASITVKGTNVGTITDDMGKFILETSMSPPFSLLCNYVGYAPKEVLVNSEVSEIKFNLGQTNIISDGYSGDTDPRFRRY